MDSPFTVSPQLDPEQIESIRNAPEGTEFSAVWRNKFLCADASSMSEFGQILADAALMIARWEALGITMRPEGVEDDYATFVTTSKDVALAEGFLPDGDGFHDGDDD